MEMEPFSLIGAHTRLDQLEDHHAEALAAASSRDPGIYRWSPVPQGIEAARLYIETALKWKRAGTAVPFVIAYRWLSHWFDTILESRVLLWPYSDSRYGREYPDACEIGYTWLTSTALRSSTNTETKLLMLTHVFETWGVLRVCLHTDVRNFRSRAAIERIVGKYEGILRAHRMAADFTARDSVPYSILYEEWPAINHRLHDVARYLNLKISEMALVYCT